MRHDISMRTTLTIDDAIARALKELAHRSNKPFNQVVNETLRAGLGAPERTLQGQAGGARRRSARRQPRQGAGARRRDRGSGARGQDAAAQGILVHANLLT
jgi:predicted transcriptional regulator